MERMFLLLPLEHSESKEDGNLSVETFTKLAQIVKEDKTSNQNYDVMVKFAKDHNDTI